MATNDQENKPGPVSLADEEAVKQILVNTIFGLWDRQSPAKFRCRSCPIFGSREIPPLANLFQFRVVPEKRAREIRVPEIRVPENEAGGFVISYTVNGKKYGLIPSWHSHIGHRELHNAKGR
jgi:hypothetical protein